MSSSVTYDADSVHENICLTTDRPTDQTSRRVLQQRVEVEMSTQIHTVSVQNADSTSCGSQKNNG